MKKLLYFFIFLFSISTAYAQLNLTLTQGISGAVPIVITPFDGDINNITQVINNDLTNSGRFKVQNSGDATLTGSVSSSGFSNYKIHFQLFGKDKSGPALLDQTMVVSKNQLRQAAHHVSDMVYQNLTGIKGIFSTRIAYVLANNGKYALDIADYDGYNPQSILTSNQPIMSPAWSRDGKKIAYVSFENNRSQIYVSDVATGSRTLMSQSEGINGAPAWSPDDSKMALVLSTTGNPKIYLMNVADKSTTQLTSGSSIDTEPSFAPDGRSLLFTSDRGGSPQIYRLVLGNNQIQRMTFNGNYNARASFSPEGSQIVMIHSDSSGYGIGLQDLQSGAYLTLDNAGDDQSPSFAPNGQMVVFATKAGRDRQLAVVSTDGKIKLRLPSDQGDVQEPVWSPFLN